jgi:STAS domain
VNHRPPSEANPPEPSAVVCDVSRIVEPDGPTLDALVRLALTARRMGTSIELRNVCAELADLIAIAGLTDVLVISGSVVEMDGQVEQHEERGIDEEVLRDDGAA